MSTGFDLASNRKQLAQATSTITFTDNDAPDPSVYKFFSSNDDNRTCGVTDGTHSCPKAYQSNGCLKWICNDCDKEILTVYEASPNTAASNSTA